jgi:hypothetical protein
MPSPLFGYSDFEYDTRSEIVDKLFTRWDTVFQNWLGGEYGNKVWLEDVLTADPEAQDLKDIHWCLYCHFTGDYDGKYYNYVEASDWLLEHSGFSRWPLSLKEFKREIMIPTALPVTPEIIDALPVGPNMPNLPVALQVTIPVLEPIRRVKRHNVRDLEELSASEESDLESVALPVEPVVRRSKRVRYARDFYYGY